MKDKKILSVAKYHNFLRITLLSTLTLLLLISIETKAQNSAVSFEKTSQKINVREKALSNLIDIESWSIDETKEFIKSKLEDYSEDINTDTSFGTAKKVFADDQILEFREKLLQEGYQNKDLEIFKPEGCYIWLFYNINTSRLVGSSIRLTRIPFADLIIQNPESVKKEVHLDTLYGKRSVVEYAFPSVGNYWITKNSSAYITMSHPKIGKEVTRAFNHVAKLCKKQLQVEGN